MSTIYIVRHGDTFAPGEVVRRIGAGTDLPLADAGRAQAERLRAWFIERDVRFDAAWAGPLARTSQTAELILAGSGLSATSADWLTEIDHGPDEGRPETDVQARHGSALARWDMEGVLPEGWRADVPARRAGWRAFLAARAAATGMALCVTSNGAARFALRSDPGLAEDCGRLPSLKLRTGAWGRIEAHAGVWRITAWDERP